MTEEHQLSYSYILANTIAVIIVKNIAFSFSHHVQMTVIFFFDQFRL